MWGGLDTHGEHEEQEPIMESGGGAPCGVKGQSTGKGVRGQSPLKLKTF